MLTPNSQSILYMGYLFFSDFTQDDNKSWVERGRNTLEVVTLLIKVESQGKSNSASWVKIKTKNNDITEKQE